MLAAPIELDGSRGDLGPFGALDDLADRARVAFIVEMDHFVHEKYDFRLLCIRYLASRGWRWFGEELDWRQGERVDRFLTTGDESQLDPIDEPHWYTGGILRTATERHPRQAMDAEQRRFARAVRGAVPSARWFGFDIGGAETEYLSMANAAETFEDLVPVMAYRERLMYERVDRALDAHGKVALMAGSTHLMKDDALVDAPGGVGPGGGIEPSIGHHVAHRAGPVLSIWLLHGGGTSANPWLPPPGTLVSAPGSVDAALAERCDQPCLVVVDEPDGDPRRVTQMHNLVLSCRLTDQVDAIVFAPTRHSPAAVIRAVVFDFDGLMLDTELPVYRSWAEVYDAHGVELELVLWQSIIGTDGFDPTTYLESKLGRPLEWDEIHQRRRSRHDELQASEQVLPGVVDWLDAAARRGLALGVASSSPRDWVTGHLARIGLLDRFACIRCRDNVGAAKPDPASYVAVLSGLGVAADEAIAVEDSVHGVAAAKAAGLYCVAVPNPLTRGMDFGAADLVVSSLAATSLEAVIGELP